MWFVDDTGYDLVLTPFEEDNDLEYPGQDEQQDIIADMEEPRRNYMDVDKMFHSAYHEWQFKDYSK
jgi:hypothetical protein